MAESKCFEKRGLESELENTDDRTVYHWTVLVTFQKRQVNKRTITASLLRTMRCSLNRQVVFSTNSNHGD